MTEEDIAFCMGELENPLPEVDQEEHPLRVLSQENMTVVSTFTGTCASRVFPACLFFLSFVQYGIYYKFNCFFVPPPLLRLAADSLSVANDIERVFSRPGGGNSSSFRRQFDHHRLQSATQHEQKSSKGMRAPPYSVLRGKQEKVF